MPTANGRGLCDCLCDGTGYCAKPEGEEPCLNGLGMIADNAETEDAEVTCL